MNKSRQQLRAAGDAVLFGDILTTRWYPSIQADFISLCEEIGVVFDLKTGIFEVTPEQAERIRGRWSTY